MGRGGGSSGGHGGSGGHFHYSSGGRSGRSSHSYSSSSRPSYSRSYGRTWSSPVNTYVSRHNSLTTAIVSVLMIMLVSLMLASHLGTNTITRSTHERGKLNSKYCQLVDTWYIDDIDWIHDENKLIEGLRSFYDQTGVQPMLYITDNIYGNPRPTSSEFERKLQKMYHATFSDEGHVIVCFMESSPSDYATYYYAGAKAKNVIDSEGGEILLDYLDFFYTDDLSDEEFFAKSFTKAAERMMSVQKTSRQLIILLACLVVGVVGSTIVCIMIYKSVKEKREQAEADAKILNTKIEEED